MGDSARTSCCIDVRAHFASSQNADVVEAIRKRTYRPVNHRQKTQLNHCRYRVKEVAQ